ncbi:dihydrofolate reductase [Bacteriovoracaceae bacterium]|nr:dihydrofolate reductase [Bacteriovoracaceae bacterium]
MKLSLIAAIGKNNELGFQGDMPWKLSDDLKLFKKITDGHPMLMGRKTFDSLPGVLPNRHHFVLTRNPNKFENKSAVTYIQNIKEINSTEQSKLFVIGGGEIYSQFSDHCTDFFITRVEGEFPQADTYFPKIDFEQMNCMEKQSYEQSNKNQYAFTFYHYRK